MSDSLTLPPPGEELERFIDHMTVPGALTWKALPTALPWTAPPGGGRRDPSEDQLTEALASVGVRGPARWYVINGPYTDVMVTSARELHRNIGRPARAVEVAVEHDVLGRSLLELSK